MTGIEDTILKLYGVEYSGANTVKLMKRLGLDRVEPKSLPRKHPCSLSRLFWENRGYSQVYPRVFHKAVHRWPPRPKTGAAASRKAEPVFPGPGISRARFSGDGRTATIATLCGLPLFTSLRWNAAIQGLSPTRLSSPHRTPARPVIAVARVWRHAGQRLTIPDHAGLPPGGPVCDPAPADPQARDGLDDPSAGTRQVMGLRRDSNPGPGAERSSKTSGSPGIDLSISHTCVSYLIACHEPKHANPPSIC